MADLTPTKGKLKLLNGTIPWVSATIKAVLVDNTFAPAVTDEFVSDGTASDIESHEIVTTNYTRGFGGSGRKALANKTITEQGTGVKFDADDIVWSGLGNGTNANIGGACLIVETGNDGSSHFVHFFDTNNLSTNSGNVTLSFHATNGIFLVP